MSNIIDFNKGKKAVLDKKKTQEQEYKEAIDYFERNYSPIPKQESFDDKPFDEKVRICIKEQWSLHTYINEVSLDRAINRMRSYCPEGYEKRDPEKIIPYDKWVIKKLSQLYPDEAKSAKVVAITSD